MRQIVLLFLLSVTIPSFAAEVVLPSGLVHRFEAEKRFQIARVWQASLPVGAAERVEHVVLDRGWMFVETSGAQVFALDAETGALHWKQIFGKPQYQTGLIAASEKHVALVNGSRIFVALKADGKELWSKPEPKVSFVQPGLSETHIYYPTNAGLVSALKIEKNKTESGFPATYSSLGRLVGGPIIANDNIIWANELGEIKFAPTGSGGAAGRFQTAGKMAAPLAHGRESIFAATLEGYVYCLATINGEQRWRASVGGGVFLAPAVVGDDVAVVTETRELHVLNASTGEERWLAEGVAQFVAASKQKIFARGISKQLLILDRATGRLERSMPAERIDSMSSNGMNDRLVFWSKDGLMQVYRDASQEKPIAYQNQPWVLKKEATPSPNDSMEGGQGATVDDSANQPLSGESSDETSPEDASDESGDESTGEADDGSTEQGEGGGGFKALKGLFGLGGKKTEDAAEPVDDSADALEADSAMEAE